MIIPDKDTIYPIKDYTKMVLLKNIIQSSNIIVGNYTYYDDKEDGMNFEKNVLYHFDFIGDLLIIGNFCAIASDVQFIMNGANHEMETLSTFPFYIIGGDWKQIAPKFENLSPKRNTIIENDVWIGYKATIMPGIKVGNGAIIGAFSVVTKDVPPYTIVGGNPARIIRQRFSDKDIQRMEQLAWWSWTSKQITKALPLIAGKNISELETYYKNEVES